MSSLTSVIRYFRAIDTSASDGSGKTGIAFGSFTAKYLTQGGTLVTLTPETITTLGTYQAPTANTNIRIKELANTDPTKGIYEVHFHNDQVAEAGKILWLFLFASGAVIQPLEVDLLPYKSDVDTVKGVDATALSKSINAIGYGTVGTSSSTTSVTTSAMNPSGAGSADEFKNRSIVFANDTATAALRGATSDITASTQSATPTLTVSPALPGTPVSGDTFVVV